MLNTKTGKEELLVFDRLISWGISNLLVPATVVVIGKNSSVETQMDFEPNTFVCNLLDCTTIDGDISSDAHPTIFKVVGVSSIWNVSI